MQDQETVVKHKKHISTNLKIVKFKYQFLVHSKVISKEQKQEKFNFQESD